MIFMKWRYRLQDPVEADAGRRAKKEAADREAAGAAGAAKDFMIRLANETDPAVRQQMAETFVTQRRTEAKQPNSPAEVAAEAALIVAQRELSDAKAAQDPVAARRVFARFSQNRPMFNSLAAAAGVTPEERDAMWAEMNGQTARERGQAVRQGAADMWSGVNNFLGGVVFGAKPE